METALLEREDALRTLTGALRAAVNGHGRLVLLTGEAGIGRTALIESFAAGVPRQVRVMIGHCEPLSTPRIFGPLIDVAPRLRPLVGHDDLFDTVLAELADQPTVLVIEDAHTADEMTLDLLRFLARRISGVPAVVVVTFRGDEVGRTHRLARLLGDLASSPSVQRIELDRLSRAAVAALAADHPVDVEELYRLTAGNPFLVTEVLASASGSVPVRVRAAVHGRVARLSAAANAAVEALAVTGAPMPLDELGDMAAGAREAVDAGLLCMDRTSIGFRHELARLAVLDTVPLFGRPEPRRVAVASTHGRLRIQTFGSARVHCGPKLLAAAEWSYAKPRELLYFLVSHPASTKDQIGAGLWPWTSPAKLRNSFHTTLHHLRRALGAPDWVTYEQGRYAFNRTLPYTCDTEVLEAGLAHARGAGPSAVPYLVKAVEAYQGEFLADMPGQPWIEDRRAELRSAFEQVLLVLGDQYERTNRLAEAAEVYKRAIRHDNLLEVAHRRLIRCYASMGEPARALRQYRELTVLLRDELGITPSAETRELHHALRVGASPITSPSA